MQIFTVCQWIRGEVELSMRYRLSFSPFSLSLPLPFRRATNQCDDENWLLMFVCRIKCQKWMRDTDTRNHRKCKLSSADDKSDKFSNIFCGQKQRIIWTFESLNGTKMWRPSIAVEKPFSVATNVVALQPSPPKPKHENFVSYIILNSFEIHWKLWPMFCQDSDNHKLFNFVRNC